MCKSGKVRHPSRVAAIITAKRIKNKGLNIYRCPQCKGWHLGNSRRDYDFQARIDQLLGKS